ncbi:hypothetical protein [Dyadobacter aurulentus]|uniref:hypothetical protein n=1 Tax=Dyadobacter sp. UC 10 TaxID=2605428 RepID=UPI0011F1F6AB|nr:hypothetical protein [Dyadobacter sp. UC 10]KAA0992406.1 hypothetical protein FXO21_20580 [Dyadobacter sp. UC 10]
MKNLALCLLSLTFFLFSGCDRDNHSNRVNMIIGDLSFVETYGFEPDENTDNDLRIRTHLQYVERLLRSKDISFLSKELKNKRTEMLDLLHQYAGNGKYPRNYDYPEESKPCFIDKDGNICAVGYLIEKTAGRKVAETINASHKYEALMDIKNADIDRWIASSGLSKEECAMIQPTYGPNGPGPGPSMPAPNYRYRMKSGFVISSGILIGTNVGLNVLNETNIANGSTNKSVPIVGLLTGAGQIALGAIGYHPDNSKSVDYNYSDQRTLSLINIELGTASMFFSGRNLVRQQKMARRRTSWNVFSFPAGRNQTGVGLSLSRKI